MKSLKGWQVGLFGLVLAVAALHGVLSGAPAASSGASFGTAPPARRPQVQHGEIDARSRTELEAILERAEPGGRQER